jgi:uncharacterized protein
MLWVSAVLVLNIPLVLILMAVVNGPPGPEQQAAAAESTRQFAEMAQHLYDAKRGGTLAELMQANAGLGALMKFGYVVISGRLWITFACFLLGMCAWRAGLFVDTPENRARMRRILTVGGAIALVGSLLVLQFPATTGVPESGTGVFAVFVAGVQNASLAAFLIAGVSLLYWRAPDRGPLPALAPMGRMGLTTYLMQTLFGAIVFYGVGFGLIGQLGVGLGVLVGLLCCVFQVFFSRVWLRHFTMGPFEWLWRSLTYFKLQPLSRRPVVTAA